MHVCSSTRGCAKIVLCKDYADDSSCGLLHAFSCSEQASYVVKPLGAAACVMRLLQYPAFAL
jgi:hypothetical protein